MKKWIQTLEPGALFRRLFLSWLTGVTVSYLFLPAADRSLKGLSALAGASVPVLVLTALAVFAAAQYVSTRKDTEKWERWGLCGIFAILASISLFSSYHTAYFVLCVIVLGVLVVYGLKGRDTMPDAPYKKEKTNFVFPVLTGLLAIAFLVFVSKWTIYRVKCFWTPSYDFGIFSQMFHNMRTTGLPMTTLERDGLLSHFQVHVSPIYYLLLPFYAIVPRPETLQVLQAAVLASSVIPLWKLGTLKNMHGLSKLLLCALLLLYPAFSGGASYDIHENCFLAPLILWLMYGLEKGSVPITAVSALLTLCVKEDAPVYVAVAGLYWLVKTLLDRQENFRKELITSLSLIGGALAWFWGATAYLTAYGDGVMSYRYDNFMFDGGNSLMTVIKAVLLNPLKALYECVDKEKLDFISRTMLPLLGLPFLTRRFERYILLIPYILVNLMSDYTYQHDIFFQYTFGSTAFLFYLAAVNVSRWKVAWVRVGALAAGVILAATPFFQVVYPEGKEMEKLYKDYESYYSGIAQALDTVPDDVSVAATTFYTVHLSDREILYDVKYCSKEHLLETEYVALHATSTTDYSRWGGYQGLVDLLTSNGYTLYHKVGNYLAIYQKTPSH